jgi:hypothetical protein
MGLIPDPVYYIGTPILISQGTVFRIYHPGKNASCAFLDTAKTTVAGIQVFRFAHGAHVKVVILEDTVNAFFLHTLSAAAGAVFAELNRGIFADGMVPWISGFNGYMILLGHRTLQFEYKPFQKYI